MYYEYRYNDLLMYVLKHWFKTQGIDNIRAKIVSTLFKYLWANVYIRYWVFVYNKQ